MPPEAKRFLLTFRRWPVLLAIAAVFFVDLFDSFGLDQAADEQAARIIGTVHAPFYGNTGRLGQKSIVVVLIDQATLDHMGWGWPAPYSGQADIVSAIAQHQPAAIFLDFSYGRPHEFLITHENELLPDPIDSFVARLRSATTAPTVPLMIGDVAEETHDALKPLAELQSVGVAWHSSTWLEYPVRDVNGREMAAFALYRAWCDYTKASACGWTPDPRTPLAITWGLGSTPASAAINGREDNACVMNNTDFATRFAKAVREGWEALGRAFYDPDKDDRAEARCIYTDYLNAATLLTSAGPEVEAMIKGRVVLVGASHRDSADLQTIPHIGVVPGVFVHAMALDNLIEQGMHYTRPPPDGPLALDLGDIVEMILTGVLFGLVIWMRNIVLTDKDPTARRRGRAVLALSYIALGVVFIVGVVILEYLLHWPPLNIVGVLVVIFVLFEFLEEHFNKELADSGAADSLPR